MTDAQPDENWLQEHAAYLQTEDWQLRRRAVLVRDRGQCQAKLLGCSSRADEVHHLTYRHWREEPLFDLVAICRPCHRRLTALDRGEVAPWGSVTMAERQQQLSRVAAVIRENEAQVW